MLITNDVEVKLRGSKSIPYYREIGYEIPCKKDKYGRTVIDHSKTLTVKVKDLPIYSEVRVTVKCDYGKEGCKGIYTKNAGDYIKNNINSVVHTDCCSNRRCQAQKTKECNMVNYGVETSIEMDGVKEKIAKSNMERYGSSSVFGSDYFKDNRIKFVFDRYGVDYVSQLESVKLKKAETFYKNGTVATSRQQKYIHNLLGGVLNYSNDTPSLDIAFPDDKIYIEVNGSGHDLCVKMNQMSQFDFDSRERKRYYYMKRRGWKGIFINTLCDYLPSDEVIIQEFNKALEWLKSDESGHWHYNIDIGKLINDNTYGKLRKIKDVDLIEEVG